MKTTIDLPDDILRRAKIVAAERRTTLKALVLAGLVQVIRPTAATDGTEAAMARLQKGLRLAGKPLTRDQLHERHPVS